jgi:hypothetical protein
MKKIFTILISLTTISSIASAQVGDTIKTLFGSVETLIADALSGLLLSASVAAFLYNVVRFIIARDGSGDSIKDAKEKLLWSILALTVMFSIWGIVQFLQSSFGFTGKTNISPPSLKIKVDPQQQSKNKQEDPNIEFLKEQERLMLECTSGQPYNKWVPKQNGKGGECKNVQA